MDPDMVRQQEEAEREALMLLARQKPMPAAHTATAGPVAAAMSEPFYFQALPEARAMPEPMAAETAAPPALPGRPALPPYEALRPFRPRPVRPPIWLTAFETAGRFVSFGVAGAMLGGGRGIVAAYYLDMSVEVAKAVIFGPATVFAAICAIMSFFAEGAPPPQYRTL